MREIIDLTKALIRFQSMHSKPEEIQHCASFIEDYLKKHGIQYRRQDRGNIPSILVLPEQSFARVLFMSHIDVVDAPEELFTPVEKNGKLFGRGSIDDKYAAALSLVLLKEKRKALEGRGKGQKDLPFGVLITGDEEIGGARGAKEALKGIKASFCVALDGGNIEKIVVKEKGVLRVRLLSHGKAAHGARPWLGENAIEKLFEDYSKIKSLFQGNAPDHWHRTINFGMVRAGKSHNQVPDRAEGILDIRYTENDDVDRLVEAMQSEIDADLILEGREPLFYGGDSPYLDLLLDIAKGSALGFEHGASDARFLSDYGINGIVWGADGDMSFHTSDEHVNIDSVYRLYGILDEFLDRCEDLPT